MELTNEQKILNNKKFQYKLSYHRNETKNILDNIENFFSDNFDYVLPKFKKIFNQKSLNYKSDQTEFIKDNYSNVINVYYRLKEFGVSVGGLFQNEKGNFETFSVAHIYSKHKLDPVWNYRKSNLIRSIYRKYLLNTNLHELYEPMHLVLTLPHRNGKYEGKKFYVKELIKHFHELRRNNFFKNSIHGGEYGVEVKESRDKKKGLHIHIHSLIFIKSEVKINLLRELIKNEWQRITGATQIWLESLYFYQRDEAGKFIMKIKEIAGDTYEDDGTYTTESKFELIKKKFYLNDYKRDVNKNTELTAEQKKELILEKYLWGILECIKYHFKIDSFKDENGNYNIEFIEEFLENTKNLRLYSRFGAFYNVKELCFNKLDKDDDEPMAEVCEELINPFTNENVNLENVELVLFYPEYQKRANKNDKEPYKLLNYKVDIYEPLPKLDTIKATMSSYFKNKFPKKLKYQYKVINKEK